MMDRTKELLITLSVFLAFLSGLFCRFAYSTPKAGDELMGGWTPESAAQTRVVLFGLGMVALGCCVAFIVCWFLVRRSKS